MSVSSALELSLLNCTSALDNVDLEDPRVLGSLLPLGIICLVVIFGNMMVIAAVQMTHKLRGATNLFIVSLAWADLMLGLVVLPFSAMYEVFDIWVFGSIWCSIWLAVDVWMCTASILHLVVISLDRYIAVTRPITYPNIMTSKRAKLLICAAWVLSFVICFPPLVGWNEESQTTQLVASVKVANTSVALDTREMLERCHPQCQLIQEKGYVIYSAVGSFYAPMLVMIFFNWRIYRTATKTTKAIRQGFTKVKGQGQSSMMGVHRGGGASIHRNKVNLSENRRASLMPTSVNESQTRVLRRQQTTTASRNAAQRSTLPRCVLNGGINNNALNEGKIEASRRMGRRRNEERDKDEEQLNHPLLMTSNDSNTEDANNKVRNNEVMSQEYNRLSGSAQNLLQVPSLSSSTSNSTSNFRQLLMQQRPQQQQHRSCPNHVGNKTFVEHGTQTSLEERRNNNTRRNAQPKRFKLLWRSPRESEQRSASPCSIERVSRRRQYIGCCHFTRWRRVIMSRRSNNSDNNEMSQNNSDDNHNVEASSNRNQEGNTNGGSMTSVNAVAALSTSSSSRLGKRNIKSQVRRFRMETKAAKTLGIIVGCFICCWFPFFTLYLVTAFCEDCVPNLAFSIFFWLGYCNSAINPFIYAMFSRDFRNAFKKILCKFLCNQTQHEGVAALARMGGLPFAPHAVAIGLTTSNSSHVQQQQRHLAAPSSSSRKASYQSQHSLAIT